MGTSDQLHIWREIIGVVIGVANSSCNPTVEGGIYNV